LDIPAEGKWAGFYNPGSKTIHLDVPPMEELDEQQMRQTIIHEYSHHLLSTFLNEHNINTIPPEWFYEGVAGYLEKKNSIIYEEELVNIQYLSFSHLDTQSEWDEGLQSPFSPYLQSYLFINYLIEDKGINVVSTILLNSKKETFLDGFELTVGKTLSEYEEPFFEKLSSIEALFKSALSMRLNQDNSDGALHTLFDIISVVPNHNLANHNIANIYFDNGDYEKAIEYRKKVVNLDPEYAPSYTYLSTTLLFFDVEEALEVEKIGLEYAKRYGEGINFSQSRIEDLSYIIKSKQEGNAYKGYLKIIKEDDFWYMKDKNKVDLIKLVLQQSPEVDTPEKRELISILNQLEKVN
jgi:tetratricopeptide (TPR) repeat protein